MTQPTEATMNTTTPGEEALSIAQQVADSTSYGPKTANYARCFQAAYKAAITMQSQQAAVEADKAALVEAVKAAARNAEPKRGEVSLHATDWQRIMDALRTTEGGGA